MRRNKGIVESEMPLILKDSCTIEQVELVLAGGLQ